MDKNDKASAGHEVNLDSLVSQNEEMRLWIIECRDKILFPLSHEESERGVCAECLGAATVKILANTQESEIERINKRLKMLECQHDDWVYEKCIFSWFDRDRYQRRCRACGKVVPLLKEDWLQEQADMHYEKHCQMIEKINELEGGK